MGLVPLITPLNRNDILKNKFVITKDREIIKSILVQSYFDGQVNINIKKNGTSVYSKNYSLNEGVATLDLDKFIMVKKDDNVMVEIKNLSSSLIAIPMMEDKSEYIYISADARYLRYNLNVSNVSTYVSGGKEWPLKRVLEVEYEGMFTNIPETVASGVVCICIKALQH